MATLDSVWLVHQPEQNHLVPHAQDCAIHLGATLESVTLADFLAHASDYLAKSRRVVAMLESVDLGPLMQCAHENAFSLGLLPVHAKSKVCRLFGIPRNMEDAMPLALKEDGGINLDLLFCNDEIIIWMLTLGDVPFIELRQIAYQEGLIWQRFKTLPASVLSLFLLQPKFVIVTTAKDTKIKTAVIGAMVIENDIESLAPHFANETTSTMDGKLSAVLVAPTSIMDYLGFFATVLSPRPRQHKAISYIKTAGMTLESPVEMDYYIDGQQRTAKHLAFRVIPRAVNVRVGQSFAATNQTAENDKDMVKVQTLPQNEERLTTMKKRLPLFSTAQEDDFKDTFITLRDYTRLSTPFALLMVLSTTLATLGLFMNNTPVVIGAMLLAPLMGPLVSLAMGILRNDNKLLNGALKVFGIGTGLTLLVAAITTLMLPYEQVTEEIRSRLHPNFLDLGIAVVSGMAAAYAHARENVQKSLPGVAIAVALVPPACVMGIGLGWMDLGVISGAGLLFLTNLVGVTLAGMLTFLCLGFAPVISVTRSLGFSLLLAFLVSIPLYQAFKNTVVYQGTEKSISTQTYQVNGKTINLSDVLVFPEGDKIKILAQAHSSESIEAADIVALRDFISDQLQEPVLLDVSLRLVK